MSVSTGCWHLGHLNVTEHFIRAGTVKAGSWGPEGFRVPTLRGLPPHWGRQCTNDSKARSADQWPVKQYGLKNKGRGPHSHSWGGERGCQDPGFMQHLPSFPNWNG